jgi:hypothetical protein
MKFNSGTNNREMVGAERFSSPSSSRTTLAIDDDGTPYVAYQDRSIDGKATVMKFDSGTNNRDVVGAERFSSVSAEILSFALDDAGTPYVAYSDGSLENRATVMKFNGANREVVGTGGFTNPNIDHPSLALYDGMPYLAYADGSNDNRITVMKFNGVNREAVGSEMFSNPSSSTTTLAIDDSGTPYVAYADRSIDGKATVMKFNGSDRETVGMSRFSDNGADYISFSLSNGIPYIAYKDGGDGDGIQNGRATVMKFNSETDSWQSVGIKGFSDRNIEYASFAIDATGNAYFAYQDPSIEYRLIAMKFIP